MGFLTGKVACLLHVGPQVWEAQTVSQSAPSLGQVSTHVDLLFLTGPSQGPWSQLLPVFFSFILHSCMIFLAALVL